MSVSRGGSSTENLIEGGRNGHTLHKSLILYPTFWFQKPNNNFKIAFAPYHTLLPSATLDIRHNIFLQSVLPATLTDKNQ